MLCDNQCISSNDNNCGSCGRVCEPGTHCDTETLGSTFCNPCAAGTSPALCQPTAERFCVELGCGLDIVRFEDGTVGCVKRCS